MDSRAKREGSGGSKGMTGVGHDSSEAPVDDESAAASWETTGDAAVAAEEMTTNEHGHSRSIKQAFFVLRLGSLLAMAGGLLPLLVLDVSQSATTLWGAT